MQACFIFRDGSTLTLNQRGAHDINNELVFKSNPGYVFHDTPGFEAGDRSQLESVKDFIMQRSKETDLSQQLHVIWYDLIVYVLTN